MQEYDILGLEDGLDYKNYFYTATCASESAVVYRVHISVSYYIIVMLLTIVQ